MGLAFWKCPRRKIYAIPNESDEYSHSPPRQKKQHQLILEDITSMKNDIQMIKTFTRDATTKVPLELQVAIQEAFRCTICRTFPIQDAAKVSLVVSNVLIDGTVVMMDLPRGAHYAVQIGDLQRL